MIAIAAAQPRFSNKSSMRLKRAPYGGLSKPAPLKRACRNTGFICENVRKPASP